VPSLKSHRSGHRVQVTLTFSDSGPTTMAFTVFENSDQGATFVVTLITLPICVLVTFLRFAVIIRSGRKILVEDWFALGALFPYLAWSVYGLVRKLGPFRRLLALSYLLTDAGLSSVVVDVENGTKAIFDMPKFDPTVWKNTIIVCSTL